MTLSGCQALHGCEKKDQCLRYQNFQDHPLIGFHAYRLCKISLFTENTYPHFIEAVALCEDEEAPDRT